MLLIPLLKRDKLKKHHEHTDLQGKTQHFYIVQMMPLQQDPHHDLQSHSYVCSRAIQTYLISTHTQE